MNWDGWEQWKPFQLNKIGKGSGINLKGVKMPYFDMEYRKNQESKWKKITQFIADTQEMAMAELKGMLRDYMGYKDTEVRMCFSVDRPLTQAERLSKLL